MINPETIFSKIIRKEIPAKIVYEDDLSLAFHDVAPQAPVHVLVIPKIFIKNLADCEAEHKRLLGHLQWVCVHVAKILNLAEFRIVINSGESSGQSVLHLHYHILGGRPFSWPPG